jgi:hypothetical protein
MDINYTNSMKVINKYKLIAKLEIQIGVLILITMFCSINAANSADIFSGSRAGVTFLYGFDYHSADLLSIQEIGTCCPKNLDGTGNSMIFTLDYGINIIESGFLTFSLGYSNRNASLSAKEIEVINLDSTAIKGYFSHDLELDYSAFILGIGYQQDISGMVGFGLTLMYEMPLPNEFHYAENLLSPADRGYFPDTGTRRRNEKSGEFSGLSSGIIHMNIFISRELPLDADFNWVAVPKIGFNSVIGSIDKNSGWSFYSIFIGVSISRNSIF